MNPRKKELMLAAIPILSELSSITVNAPLLSVSRLEQLLKIPVASDNDICREIFWDLFRFGIITPFRLEDLTKRFRFHSEAKENLEKLQHELLRS